MVEREKETVIVNDGGERRPSYGWVWAVVVIVLIIILFFMFGGMNLFGGGASTPSASGGTSIQSPTSGK